MQTVNVMQSVNPATGAVLAEYPQHTPAEARARLERCGEAFARWSAEPVAERAAILARAGELLRARRE